MNETRVGQAVLEMRDITKRFGGVAALTNVSFTVQPGEVHALLGENGAGKSTLMNIATGSLHADEGAIIIDGEAIEHLTPITATKQGIAIVHQHPAVLEDLSVLENLLVALPNSFFKGGNVRAKARELLDRVNLTIHLDERVETMTVAQKHLLEIAKALAVDPRVVVLDEPTAPLGSDSVDMLFELVRDSVSRGTAVIYITHRMAEVRQLADRVTVLRDGKVAGADLPVGDVTDAELLALIVGRKLESTFPEKYHAPADSPANLVVQGLSGPGFKDISFQAKRGQIIGISGVVGNGQPELLRSLAGLAPHSGTVEIDGQRLRQNDLLSRSGYMPADRHREGLIMDFTVGDNAAIAALKKFTSGPLLSRKKEVDATSEALNSLSVKARSLDAPASSLSGGNQQKIVMARTMLSEPQLVLADEPTQGVDVGARAELYGILREISSNGTPVIVNSSDAMELEGLCDVVLVMSRGQIVEVLSGDDISEERMVHAAVSAQTHSIEVPRKREAADSGRLRRFLRGDYAPPAMLVLVIIALAAYIFTVNERYLNDFNINSVLMLTTALGFIALGQTVALLIGGIDLSVGPLAGLLVVVGSFFINDGSAVGSIILGFAAMILVSLVVGHLNGVLIRFGRFTAVAATLTLYIALQGLSFILRPTPGGSINRDIIAVLQLKLGPIPLVFLAMIVAVAILEYYLRRTRWGWNIRATGSDQANARRVGVKLNREVVGAFVLTSFMTFFGAVILMAQIGLGDPAQGVNYTLSSITAVVLGGTSLLGGRGSFIGSALGALLLTQVLNATVFLRLDQSWQYWLQGGMILIAAVLYTLARHRRRAREGVAA
ncbi:ATP-binding cassette domain-containing protein [Tessaracoccus sp. MC1756]|uniref:ATP-binding cassette domain-containing protein n=1 Tax=Tessaracoccus sp. MC1756 TaxID=2760311 RepID=UPI0015FF5949|nr:ATP-binding cassette domain-containing protein [Tessaracoccus sp. MC1756]MBB1510942.1 ATP-binding cassette domain-containing protein [Tessaracoccus sp. MC1756]